MALDYKELSKKFDKVFKKKLKKITPEELEKYFPEDKKPYGWLSIEDYLPVCMADDFCKQGYSVYTVKDIHENEFDIAVCDHHTWYHDAKKIGITHWWNEEGIKDE